MRVTKAALGIGLLMSTCTPALAQSSDEAQKQATRLISQAISERVSRSVDLATGSAGADRADSSKSAWVLGSYTDLGVGRDKFADLYLVSGGIDKRDGRLTYGVSASFAHFKGATLNFDDGLGGTLKFNLGSANSVTVSPYAAYQTSDHTFISGIVNLSHTFTNGGGIGGVAGGGFGGDTTDASFEAAFNAFHRSEKFTVRGKVAYRGSFGIDPGSDLSSTLVAFGEGELTISPKAAFYLNAEANLGLEEATDTVRTYGGLGFYFRPSDQSQFGIGYQRLLTGRGGGGGVGGKLDVSTFMAQYRGIF